MIYRRWSLLTGPPAIIGGVVAAVVVASFVLPSAAFCPSPLPSAFLVYRYGNHNLLGSVGVGGD
ncbi:hypothetical protein C5167_021833 [Papaver somniferum]|uniref:Uncharacterized protein n=1 Tax=Papaver somniferum TaxID=3469 RepID=A0A4Y7JJ51_PAPSO|nr:hypothetical protein C5167_021833 [Papaver somniferum]